MVLTTDDIAAIAAVMEQHHVCRYDIKPKDLESVVKFVNGVHSGVTEYQSGLKRVIIRIAVYATIAGAINFVAEKLGLPSLRTLINFLVK